MYLPFKRDQVAIWNIPHLQEDALRIFDKNLILTHHGVKMFLENFLSVFQKDQLPTQTNSLLEMNISPS